VAEPIIRCTNVLKVYESPTGRVQAVRGIDLSVPAGRAVALVGPSGSGKSSLLRIVAGLDEPTAGQVMIRGVDLTRLSPARRRRVRARLLSHVYQRPTDNLLGHLTALEQVERVARRRRATPGAAGAMLERVGLDGRLHHRPHQLSGGEQQRLAFARGAVGDPALVIADEPTAELDSASTTRVLDTVDALTSDGITVLLATHDPQVIERLDHVVTLHDGAVASVTEAGTELAVIDDAGRLQLPVNVRAHFPDDRARLTWDGESRRLVVEAP
jgi:putative ABC transport system ATP-binding protein